MIPRAQHVHICYEYMFVSPQVQNTEQLPPTDGSTITAYSYYGGECMVRDLFNNHDTQTPLLSDTVDIDSRPRTSRQCYTGAHFMCFTRASRWSSGGKRQQIYSTVRSKCFRSKAVVLDQVLRSCRPRRVASVHLSVMGNSKIWGYLQRRYARLYSMYKQSCLVGSVCMSSLTP